MKSNNFIAALQKYISSKKNVPFAYGTNDCFIFVCGALVAMGLEDHSKGFKYKTLNTGLRQMKRIHGFSDHIAYFESIYPEIPKPFAQIGDIAVVQTESEKAIGIVIGSEVIAVSPTGLTSINILNDQIIRVLNTNESP